MGRHNKRISDKTTHTGRTPPKQSYRSRHPNNSPVIKRKEEAEKRRQSARLSSSTTATTGWSSGEEESVSSSHDSNSLLASQSTQGTPSSSGRPSRKRRRRERQISPLSSLRIEDNTDEVRKEDEEQTDEKTNGGRKRARQSGKGEQNALPEASGTPTSTVSSSPVVESAAVVRKRGRTSSLEGEVESLQVISPGQKRRKAAAMTSGGASSSFDGDGEEDSELSTPTRNGLSSRRSVVSPPTSLVPERPGKQLVQSDRTSSPGSPRKRNGSRGPSASSIHPSRISDTPPIVLDVWENWNDGTDGKDPLVDRVWRARSPSLGHSSMTASNANSSSAPSSKEREFVVVSYNILSEFHLNRDQVKSKLKPEDWHRGQRHKLLLREVDFLDPDVLCLQEVDATYYKSMLTKDMTSRGYAGHLTLRSDNSAEGVATFYRKSRFKEIAVKSFPLRQISESILTDSSLSAELKSTIRDYLAVPNDLQTVLLTCRTTRRVLCVGNLLTDLHRGSGQQDVECVQVAGALWTINDLIQQLPGAANGNGNGSQSTSVRSRDWVLCGNLGSTPDSPAYQLCRDGYPSDSSLKLLQRVQTVAIPGQSGRQALVNLFWRAFQHPCSDIVSCYQSVLGREPPMTTNRGNQRGCHDFLWCSQAGLSPSAVLLPRSTYLRQNRDRLPNAKLPSHHASLACRLAFK